MLFDIKQFSCAAIALIGGIMLQSAAHGADYSNSSAYNTPVGMSPGQDNAPVNASLRDANGNLTVVNGEFTSAAMSHSSGVQMATSSSSGAGSSGTSGAGSMFGTATAIGNQLNVITTGSNNTVVVTSTQTNNGNQTANTTINGH